MFFPVVSTNGGTQNGWFITIMKNPIKMDEVGVPLFQETSISVRRCLWKDRQQQRRGCLIPGTLCDTCILQMRVLHVFFLT
jgi:hypothetical protein